MYHSIEIQHMGQSNLLQILEECLLQLKLVQLEGRYWWHLEYDTKEGSEQVLFRFESN